MKDREFMLYFNGKLLAEFKAISWKDAEAYVFENILSLEEVEL